MGVVTRATHMGLGLLDYFGGTWDQYLPFTTKQPFPLNYPDLKSSLPGVGRNLLVYTF